MKHYTVFVELEVEVIARDARAADRVLSEAKFVAQRPSARVSGGLHVQRVIRHSQYHHES